MLPEVPLVIVETPYRSLVTPFLHYLDVMAPTPPGTVTIVVLPEYVPRHWWDRLLHNQKSRRIREALVGRPDTVVADVPYGAERPGNGHGGGGSGATPDTVDRAQRAGSHEDLDEEPPRIRGWRR
jgi:hypothetical protein